MIILLTFYFKLIICKHWFKTTIYFNFMSFTRYCLKETSIITNITDICNDITLNRGSVAIWLNLGSSAIMMLSSGPIKEKKYHQNHTPNYWEHYCEKLFSGSTCFSFSLFFLNTVFFFCFAFEFPDHWNEKEKTELRRIKNHVYLRFTVKSTEILIRISLLWYA